MSDITESYWLYHMIDGVAFRSSLSPDRVAWNYSNDFEEFPHPSGGSSFWCKPAVISSYFLSTPTSRELDFLHNKMIEEEEKKIKGWE